MCEKELYAVAVYFDSRPGMGRNERVEIAFELFGGEFVRWAVKVLGQPANGATVEFDGRLGFALTAKCVKVFLVQ